MMPSLDYQTYQQLIRQAYSAAYSPKRAFCPLQICYTSMELGKSMGVDLTRDAFVAGYKDWKAGEACQSLRRALESTTIPGPITKIIAFANSGISNRNEAWRSRSIMQHALMLTLRDFIKSFVFGVEVKCFAQDPVYGEADRVVLQEVGITVLDDPRAFLEVDDQSVVISFAPNIPVRQIVADLARPAILIWNTVNDSEADILRYWSTRFTPPRSWVSAEHLEGHICDPESPRVRNLIRDEYFNVVKLDESSFGNAVVYIRRH